MRLLGLFNIGLTLFVGLALCRCANSAASALPAASSKSPADDKNRAEEKKKAMKRKAEERNKADRPSSFFGEVVHKAESRLWVKHANGELKIFCVGRNTKFTGVPGLGAITKGSLVALESTRKAVLAVNVIKLAPPPPPDKPEGRPVTGTLTRVRTDQYGDTGRISVQNAKGKVREFSCTNATQVFHPRSPGRFCTLQFLSAGQTVTVEHDGKGQALLIRVK
jgi:hypothetical protein